MVRTKVVLTLFAFFSDGDKTRGTAQKELLRSFADTYNLYFLLLDLVNEITTYAEQRQEENRERAQAMHTDYRANPRFVQNRFAAQLFNNRTLRRQLEQEKLSWDTSHDAVAALYKQIAETSIYEEYMRSPETSYESDKLLWRKIFSNILADNSELEKGLEELEVSLDAASWTSDMNTVISYIVKTIKRFREDAGADQPLLEMFDSEEEVEFAKRLLALAIDHSEEYERLISDKLKNWDAERVAFMDMIILKTALAEILNFPDIAIQVSLNEYLDIAREFSTDNSPQFINGMLDQIAKEQARQNKLFKALTLN